MTKGIRTTALIALLVFAGHRTAHAQDEGDNRFHAVHLSGLINDFTTPAFGSWVVHGVWSLDMSGASGAANFTAALTMERSDLFFAATSGADANNLTTRNPHTHHISVLHGSVTPIPGGFRITSMPNETIVTGNGGAAPFETDPPSSTLQIDITGGNLVPLSNIALTFAGPAAKHFGSNPLSGVVRAMK